MGKESIELTETMGTISYADDVIATIAGLACMEVEGIAGMSGGLISGVAELLGGKNLTKGVKVEVTQKDVKCDIFVVMEYGVEMHKVAENAQKAIKKEIETMAGLNVIAVNINIQGIKIEKAMISGKTADEEEAAK